jgi:hypothetical protein
MNRDYLIWYFKSPTNQFYLKVELSGGDIKAVQGESGMRRLIW